MCLAIAAPAGKQVPRAHLLAGFSTNSDGAGMAFVRDGQVIIKKGYFNAEGFANAYEEEYKLSPTSPFLVHFRTSTAGRINAENCHPFRGKYGAFVHNGIVSGMGNADESDTAELANLIKDVPEEAISKLASRLGSYTGWSKFAFLTNSGSLYFVKENDGIWDGGIWYSNACYRGTYRDRGGISMADHPWIDAGE